MSLKSFLLTDLNKWLDEWVIPLVYQNTFDRDGSCAKMGEHAESSFGKLLASKFPCRPANEYEQRRHIDFVATHPSGVKVNYDVKARKRVQRQDENPSDEMVWVEFLNVIGNMGWLYGQSQYIVFERDKDFLVVERDKLRELSERLCDLALKVPSASQALYRGYTRHGRKDLVSMVKMSDIEGICFEIWPKNSSPCLSKT